MAAKAPMSSKEPASPATPQLADRLALTEAALCRIAARAGWKVLRYRVQPGERVPWPDAEWVVTVETPERAQIAFAFTSRHAGLLGGIPQTSAYPVERKDVPIDSFESVVRTAMACFPGALVEAPLSAWNGQDGGDGSHAAALGSV